MHKKVGTTARKNIFLANMNSAAEGAPFYNSVYFNVLTLNWRDFFYVKFCVRWLTNISTRFVKYVHKPVTTHVPTTWIFLSLTRQNLQHSIQFLACVCVFVCVRACVDLDVRQHRQNRLYAPSCKLLRGRKSNKCVKHQGSVTGLHVNFETGCQTKKKKTSHTRTQITQYATL